MPITLIPDLDAEILHIEHERSLSALRSQRQRVLERLNSYKYPVLTLPNEITAEIFAHFLPLYPACPPFAGCDSPTLLTQVCCQWREVALKMPILWRAISLSDSTIPFDRKAHISMWLERSRYCPLSLHFDDDDPIYGELPAVEVLAAIIPHRARWDHVTLSLSFPSLLHTIEGPMPLLRHLHLSSTGEWDTILSFREVPLLRSVTLNLMTPLNVMLPFAQLTSITLKLVFRSEYAVILPQASNLVHCELGIVTDGYGDLAPDRDIELQCLESLVLCVDGPAPGSLDDFIVPGLRSLRLAESFLGPEPIDRLSSFIAKSGCKLQEVFVAGRTIRRGSYREGFPSILQFSFDDDSDAVNISTVPDSDISDD
ncbi:hypothetical protein K438DRAFT_1879330 [Mycena galopus ATCC 62051]|nr:hypothetical protein K438DRAFT_1879330 [Mycena galopus ATCC 62051]